MVTLPIRYPLDPTGVSPDNKIVGEPHALPNRTVRAVAPGYGSFFAESVVIRDVATGQTLVKNVQYVCTELFEFPTGRYGKEIDGIILIKDQTVSSNIEIDYQTLGGEYSTNSDAIIQMLNSAELDDRPVTWGDIIGKPDAFTPAKHFHDVGDIYGFEYVVHSIERVRQAIMIGDDASHDQIYRYIDSSFAQLNTHLTMVETNLNSHLADTNNPHRTTKAQVGLGNVDNFSTATTAIAQTGTSTTTFMTPALTAAAITQQVGNALAAHIADHNNPHATTASQVGLGLVQNFGLASTAQAQDGAVNTVYMTPQTTAAAIQSQVGSQLNAHIANINNPHQTTKAQVGLDLVDDFATATQSDAETGIAANKFMTSQRTAQAIAFQVGNAFTAHVNNVNNPHATTKAQVGLGNVDNFLTATTTQAQAGTSTTTFMTPALVAAAIQAQVGGQVTAVQTQLNNHIADHTNPHATTAAQVGLGLVQNYAVATTPQAQAGTDTNVYMTPQLTAAAIAQLAAPIWYTGWVNSPGTDANALGGSHSAFTYSNNAPYTGPVIRFDSGGYDLQLNANYSPGNALAFRVKNGDNTTWNAWHTLVDSAGTNAAGTWAINISGNAATSTTSTKTQSMIRTDDTSKTWSYSGTLPGSSPTHVLMTSDSVSMVPWPASSLSVGSAVNATFAAKASTLAQGGGTGQAMTFNWSGQGGMPPWVWGGSDGVNMYVYNPANFTVAVAQTANSAPGYLPLTGGVLQGPGNLQVVGTLTTAAINASAAITISGEWFRSNGNFGWYNNTYAGGIYMQDTSWVRIYGDKGLLTGGTIQGGNITSTGIGMFAGQVTAPNYRMTSDVRLKTNLEKVSNARRRLLDTVYGYSYVKDGQPEFGLITQEASIEFGALVSETEQTLPDGSKVQGLNYNGMWAPAVETLRDMDQQLTDHQNTIKVQQVDIARLKEVVDAQTKALQALSGQMVDFLKKAGGQ